MILLDDFFAWCDLVRMVPHFKHWIEVKWGVCGLENHDIWCLLRPNYGKLDLSISCNIIVGTIAYAQESGNLLWILSFEPCREKIWYDSKPFYNFCKEHLPSSNMSSKSLNHSLWTSPISPWPLQLCLEIGVALDFKRSLTYVFHGSMCLLVTEITPYAIVVACQNVVVAKSL